MNIIELSYPGIRIDHPDQQWSWKVSNQIHDFQAPLAEAALALTWFEDQPIANPVSPCQDPQAEWERVQEIREKIISESNLDPFTMTREEHILLNTDTQLTLKRERWASGFLPKDYSYRIVFVHAKTFLYALDRIDRLLHVLETTLGDRFDISSIRETFSASVPNLRGVRNSVAHYEDRSRGLGSNRQPIPGGALILECIGGTKFGSTTADGYYGEVDVSLSTLKASGAAVQSVINIFKWKGSPTHWPD